MYCKHSKSFYWKTHELWVRSTWRLALTKETACCTVFQTMFSPNFTVQHAAARIKTKIKKYNHITALLNDLQWFPIKQSIGYKILLLTFHSLHCLVNSYWIYLLIRHQPNRALSSADAHLVEVPRVLRTPGNKALSSEYILTHMGYRR